MGFSSLRDIAMKLVGNAPQQGAAQQSAPPALIRRAGGQRGWTGALSRHLPLMEGEDPEAVDMMMRPQNRTRMAPQQINRDQLLQMLGRLGNNLSQGTGAQQPLPPALMKRIGRWMR